jgi:hypothetical protein
MTCGRLYVHDTLLRRLPQHFEHLACAIGPLIEAEEAVGRPRYLPGHRHLPPPISPTSEIVWWGRDTAW